MGALVAGQYVKAADGTHVNTDGVKRYVALLSQAGVAAPTAVVLENSLGGAIVWSRSGAGTYTGTLAGAFPLNKTTIIASNGNAGVIIFAFWLTANTVRVLPVDIVTNTEGDDLMTNATLEIRVYP